jgi:hypothetical protein
MPWLPNPLYFVVGEWLVRNGAPIVRRTLAKSPPTVNVVFEGEARLEHGPESIDGLLTLTTAALAFTPRGIRTRGAAISLPLAEIDEVTPTRARLFGLVPFRNEGFKVRTHRGIYRFRVDGSDRSTWLRELRAALRAAHATTPATVEA